MFAILNRAVVITPNISLHESFQTLRAEIKQLLSIAIFLFLRKPIF